MSSLPHPPEDLLITLCCCFLKTLHTNRINGLKIIPTTKRKRERLQVLGNKTCILSFRHASGGRAVCRAVLSALQARQGTWSPGLSFEGFLSYTMIPKDKEKRNPLPHEEGWRDESCERKEPASCVAPLPPCPQAVKNRALDRFL